MGTEAFMVPLPPGGAKQRQADRQQPTYQLKQSTNDDISTVPSSKKALQASTDTLLPAMPVIPNLLS